MFSKQKRRPDKKRFEKVAFKRELQKARQFKRTSSFKAPSSSKFNWHIFLVALSAGTVLAGLIYILCVPNFLYVTTITVSGGDQPLQDKTKYIVEDFLQQKKYGIFSAQNQLWLNANKLEETITQQEPEVRSVSKIHKVFFKKTLEITIAPRQEAFMLESLGHKFIIADDGAVLKELSVDAQANGDLLKVFASVEPPVVGEKYFSGDLLQALITVQSDFFTLTGIGVDFVELANADGYFSGNKSSLGKSAPEFAVEVFGNPQKRTAHFVVFFDSHGDINLSLQNLKLLLQSENKGRIEQLAYVDMRFKNRGFICLRETVCVKPPLPPPPPIEALLPPPSLIPPPKVK